MSNNMKTNECRDCFTTCQETLFNYCLPKGGKHSEAEHVKLMIDCIQICQTASDFMARGSKLHASVCNSCAEICEACAKSCENIGGEEMKKCAEVCRKCAESCRKMCK